jgi:hypothetical protein
MIIVYVVFLDGRAVVCHASQINNRLEALRGPSECYWIVPGTITE